MQRAQPVLQPVLQPVPQPVLTVRYPDGRDELMARAALLNLLMVGKIPSGSTVRGANDETWKSLAIWHLDNSAIDPLPDIFDVAYVTKHLVGELEQMALRRGLGFADDADQIAGLTHEMVMNREVTNPDWVHLWPVAHLADEEIAVPTDEISDEGLFGRDIVIPAWGAPYHFHPEVAIDVPAWRDPATANFHLLSVAPPDWRRHPSGGGARAKVRAAPTARPTPRPPPPVRGSPERQQATAARRSSPLAPPPPPPVNARRTSSARSERSRTSEPIPQAAMGGAAAAAVAASNMIAETKSWGLFGCFGQLIVTAALGVAVLVGVDLALQAFVTSDVGVMLSDRAPSSDAGDSALGRRLLTIGPGASPVVAVLAVDMTTAEGMRVLRDTLTILRLGERRDDLYGGGRIRLVLLPTGTSAAAIPLGGALIALHHEGKLFSRLKELGVDGLDQRRLLHGLDAQFGDRAVRFADQPGTKLAVRSFGTMARALGMTAPALLINGVRVASSKLRSSAALAEVLEIALKPSNIYLAAGGAIDTTYWKTVLSPLQPRARARFLTWLIRREALPSTGAHLAPPAAPLPSVHGSAKAGAKSAAAAAGGAGKTTAKSKPSAHVTFKIPAHAPRRGPDAAAVHVVVFADFHCPFCRRLAPNLRRLRKDFGDDVQIAFLHYPLRKLHPQAAALARLSVAAHRQGRFWRLHDRIYSLKPARATPKAMRSFVRSLHGPRPIRSRQLQNDEHGGEAVLRVDRSLARRLQVRGTPTTFVNGWRVNGAVSYTKLRAIVEREIKREEHP